jgi:hypothetical protein
MNKLYLKCISFVLLFSAVLFLVACGGTQSTTGENYGDLFSSPSGLTLSEAEHGDGWARADCTLCHNLVNIHLGPDVGGFNMQAVRDLVATDGLASCPICHGDNGVQ